MGATRTNGLGDCGRVEGALVARSTPGFDAVRDGDATSPWLMGAMRVSEEVGRRKDSHALLREASRK